MRPAYFVIRAAWLGLLLLAGSVLVHAAPLPQDAAGGPITCGTADQNPPYSLAEFNAYKAASAEKDPQKQIMMLDALVAQCPKSGLLPYIDRTYYYAYYQLKNYSRTLDYSNQLLAMGDKVDLGSRVEAETARAEAYRNLQDDKSFQTPEKYAAARDAALEGLALLPQWKKPDGWTDDDFAMQQKIKTRLFNLVAGVAEAGLKDYKDAAASYKAVLAIDPTDAPIHYELGLSYLRETPPDSLDGLWEIARYAALNKSAEEQIRTYLRAQILNYQQIQKGCEKSADDEVGQILALAAGSNDRPASFSLPSSDDLKKLQQDTTDFMPWLQEGGQHGGMMWLATCGLEYSDVFARVMEVKPDTGDNLTLAVFHPAATDPDAAGKEMEGAAAPNMEVHVVGQPEAKRITKDSVVRFTGTLSGYQPTPFMLIWDSAKVNPEDIPAAKAPPARRPAPKAPAKPSN